MSADFPRAEISGKRKPMKNFAREKVRIVSDSELQIFGGRMDSQGKANAAMYL